jgi:hypothetical protein
LAAAFASAYTQAIWRLNEPTNGDAPFDLVLSHSGELFVLFVGFSGEQELIRVISY